jgi:hypothetical protein
MKRSQTNFSRVTPGAVGRLGASTIAGWQTAVTEHQMIADIERETPPVQYCQGHAVGDLLLGMSKKKLSGYPTSNIAVGDNDKSWLPASVT